MSYQLLDSTDVVQVFSPTLVSDALLCTIRSWPSGSILIRTVPAAEAAVETQIGILVSLSDAVESLLGEGIATAASGTQGLDPSGLLYDAVTFTVVYVPPYTTPGTIEGNVEIPVDVITADIGIIGGSGVESAAQRILDEYNRLKALAGG